MRHQLANIMGIYSMVSLLTVKVSNLNAQGSYDIYMFDVNTGTTNR